MSCLQCSHPAFRWQKCYNLTSSFSLDLQVCNLNLPGCIFLFFFFLHAACLYKTHGLSQVQIITFIFFLYFYWYCFLSQCKSNQKLALLACDSSLFEGIGFLLEGVHVVDWVLWLSLLFQPVSDMHFYQNVLSSKQCCVKGSQLRQGRSLMGAVDLSHKTQLGVFQLTDARRWQFIGGMAFLWECSIWTDKWRTSFRSKKKFWPKGITSTMVLGQCCWSARLVIFRNLGYQGEWNPPWEQVRAEMGVTGVGECLQLWRH